MKITDLDFPVSEIFHSIQGEGNYAGVNSLFVRFQLCNLRCPWCDTKYTWTRFSDQFDLLNADKLRRKIRERSQRHIIFTGGEPSLFRLDLLAESERMYHVESNGTIIPTQPLSIVLGDRVAIERGAMEASVISKFNWVISPKLSNSQQPLTPESIAFWAKQPYATFKFIIQDLPDLDEVDAFIDQFHINSNRVYMGLMGGTLESQLKPELVDDIIRRGYHYSPRLHILLWGQTRAK